MSKRIWIPCLLLVALLGGTFLWLAAPSREPVYEGRRLSEWLEGHTASSSHYGTPEWSKAQMALLTIGTNAIPTLLKMLRARDTTLRARLARLAQKQKWIRIRYRPAHPQHQEAEYAFRALGTNAAGAVPGLMEIYAADLSDSSLTSTALSFANIGAPARPALPLLMQSLTRTNNYVRFTAALAAMQVGMEPEIGVPVYRRLLQDSYKSIRWNAASGLGRYGQRARAAVPDLLAALQDPSIRGSVEGALWSIAPEKVGQPLMIESPTPMVSNGVTTAGIEVQFGNERRTVIRSGTAVPVLSQFWNSEPRPWVSVFRNSGRTPAAAHFLGDFEVLDMALPPTNVNVGLLFVVTEEGIFACTRDYGRDRFLETRRVSR